MALTAVSRYSNKPVILASGQHIYLPGSTIFQMPHGFPPEIDIYTIDTVQRYPLGTKLVIDDHVFRYIEFGGVTAAGDVIQAEAPDAAHDDLDLSGSGAGAGVAAGSKIISIATSITLVQDEYAGGTLTIEADTGKGYTYIIETHDIGANNLVQIKHGLAVAIDATSDGKLVKSRWKEVIQCPTALTAQVAGISIGVGADGSFGWAVTRGPWAVLTNGTVVVGNPVTPSGTTAGAVDAFDVDVAADAGVDLPLIGVVADVGPTTEYSLINVQLD